MRTAELRLLRVRRNERTQNLGKSGGFVSTESRFKVREPAHSPQAYPPPHDGGHSGYCDGGTTAQPLPILISTCNKRLPVRDTESMANSTKLLTTVIMGSHHLEYHYKRPESARVFLGVHARRVLGFLTLSFTYSFVFAAILNSCRILLNAFAFTFSSLRILLVRPHMSLI